MEPHTIIRRTSTSLNPCVEKMGYESIAGRENGVPSDFRPCSSLATLSEIVDLEHSPTVSGKVLRRFEPQEATTRAENWARERVGSSAERSMGK